MFACLNCKESFPQPEGVDNLRVCPYCHSNMIYTYGELRLVYQCLDEYRRMKRKKEKAPCSAATETRRNRLSI